MEQKIQGLDFTPIEKFAGKILNNLSETHREKLLKKISADMKRSQQKHIKAQQQPDGEPYPKRKRNHPRITLHPIKFIYDAYDTGKYRKARLVYLSTWRIYKSGKGKDSQGKYITGFDEITGGEHEEVFLWEKIFHVKNEPEKKWFLPKDSRDHERLHNNEHKLSDLSRPMFQKIRTARFLKSGIDNEAGEAWVGFLGKAAKMAEVHQNGLTEKYLRRIKRYPVRKLLGLNYDDEQRILNYIIDTIEK
ncbi:MAG: phage virion morphogenesis protein [Zymomonas mobilis]|uniref:phage virion morphogenesis protein n=1 Tax=Zymomonas mobilis TaxID=542 RepID=UPI0039ED1548